MTVWADAALAAALLAVDPAGLGGAAVRAGAGPVRDAWTDLLRTLLAEGTPVRRAPSHIGDDRLLGGLDLPASLAAGRPVAQRGLLAECDGGVVLLPMAERMEPGAAARLCAVLDAGEVTLERDGLAQRLPARLAVVALDESQADEPPPPPALIERLALLVDLSAISPREALSVTFDRRATARARTALPTIAPPGEGVVEALCAAAAMMGLDSARAPLLALRAARAHAALAGRLAIADEDAAVAARLVLAPRALTAPAAEDDQTEDEQTPPGETAADQAAPEPPPPPSSETPSDATPPAAEAPSPTDRIVEAIRAALPGDMLERIDAGAAARAAARGGRRSRTIAARAKTAPRGRPAGVRQGRPRRGERLNLVETLRAATPWQRLRGGGPSDTVKGEGAGGRVQVRAEDFRLRRFVQRSQSTTIVVVDASGSSAFQRLAEAKGAVELLLARAYVSRARVALIAFRGAAAELLLPPTRSLTRAKRRLADLPGGGGTPLAAGVDMALAVARAERAQERTPILVFLTDGQANIGLGGAPGRPAAEADALAASRRVREAGVAAAWLDTSPRPRPGGDRFARAMGAAYRPLPYAAAQAVGAIVDDLRGGAR